MSTEIQAVSHLKVKYMKGAKEDRRERATTEVEMLEDGEQHMDGDSQQAESHSEKLPCVKRGCLRVFTASLFVLNLLILAGIITSYVLVTLEKEQLQTRYNNLNNNYSQLQDKYLRKLCPEGWTRFAWSCYFKSTEKKKWFESRRDCEDRGSDLVSINTKEEQEFVSKLNMNEESWIGVRTEWKGAEHGWKWEWMDGSSLTVKFWAEGDPDPTAWSYATCCDHQGKWTQTYNSNKNWICEKYNDFLL